LLGALIFLSLTRGVPVSDVPFEPVASSEPRLPAAAPQAARADGGAGGS
jgi:hypothetical protein